MRAPYRRLPRPSARSLVHVPIPARSFDVDDLDPDPFVQFSRWYDDALEHGQLQPDAMVVASSTADGHPSARMVLLRGVDARGFCFYTNFDSRKGRELDANPRAAIAFHWPEVLRQVRATGSVVRVSDTESDRYWYARPLESRVSAWASAQSDVVTSRGRSRSPGRRRRGALRRYGCSPASRVGWISRRARRPGVLATPGRSSSRSVALHA